MLFTYKIEGMHCATCINKIKKSLSPHYKIKSITLNPAQLEIEHNKTPSLKELNKAISEAGNYQLLKNKDPIIASPNTVQTYYPLLLIIVYILGVSTLNNIHFQGID